jgi:hypothetical protein
MAKNIKYSIELIGIFFLHFFTTMIFLTRDDILDENKKIVLRLIHDVFSKFGFSPVKKNILKRLSRELDLAFDYINRKI